jgi:glycosyltransferase involved in cell wall biosynthesis
MLQTTIRIFGLMILHIRKKDKIIAVTNPPLLIPCLYLFKLLFGVEYVIIVHDLFPANLVSANVLKKQSFFLKLVNCLYFFFYSRAALIISIGRDMQNIFEQNLPKKRPKLVTITNWSDDDVVYPIPRMKCNNIYKINLQGKIVLQFAGNIGKAQNIEILLKIAEYCKNDNIHIVFIGTGEKVELIRGYIKTSIRKNITLLDYIDRSSQCEFLNSCDIGIITLRDGMYGLGVPSKAYNILAAGKPILYIGDKGSEIFKLVCENDIGWAFQSSRYGEVIEMLSKLENSIDDIIRKGKNARKVAETLTSKKYILNEYLKVLE